MINHCVTAPKIEIDPGPDHVAAQDPDGPAAGLVEWRSPRASAAGDRRRPEGRAVAQEVERQQRRQEQDQAEARRVRTRGRRWPRRRVDADRLATTSMSDRAEVRGLGRPAFAVSTISCRADHRDQGQGQDDDDHDQRRQRRSTVRAARPRPSPVGGAPLATGSSVAAEDDRQDDRDDDRRDPSRRRWIATPSERERRRAPASSTARAGRARSGRGASVIPTSRSVVERLDDGRRDRQDEGDDRQGGEQPDDPEQRGARRAGRSAPTPGGCRRSCRRSSGPGGCPG